MHDTQKAVRLVRSVREGFLGMRDVLWHGVLKKKSAFLARKDPKSLRYQYYYSAPRGKKNPLVFHNNRRQSFVSETTDDDGCQLRQARARTKRERERERTDFKERGLDILYLILLLKCNTITKRQTQHPNNKAHRFFIKSGSFEFVESIHGSRGRSVRLYRASQR